MISLARKFNRWVYAKWCKCYFMYRWYFFMNEKQRKEFYVRMRFVQDTAKKTKKHPLEVMRGMDKIAKMEEEENKKDEMA